VIVARWMIPSAWAALGAPVRGIVICSKGGSSTFLVQPGRPRIGDRRPSESGLVLPDCTGMAGGPRDAKSSKVEQKFELNECVEAKTD